MIPLLTIYIPAFNRDDELKRLLDSIHYQEDVIVHVSDDSGVERHRRLCEKYPVIYEPMRYTQGRDMNLLRGIAMCDTPWLWVIGDDDWLLPGAVGIILDACRRNDADRIILHSPEALTHMPEAVLGKSASAREIIDLLRPEPSMLIATTLCSSNVYRTRLLSLRDGLRRSDTYYGYAWSTLGCSRWHVIDRPTIKVGIDHATGIPDAHDRWQDYLDSTCDAAGAARISKGDAFAWNFTSVG